MIKSARLRAMITTADIQAESGLSQRVIQKRVAALGLRPKRAGNVMILTRAQANKIIAQSSKPGPKGKQNGLS